MRVWSRDIFGPLPRFFRRILPVLAIFLLGWLVDGARWVKAVDNQLVAARMSLSPLDTSGQVVFLAIDTHSLQAIGQWPWPRSVHARVLDGLTKAGALDVFFDIDFAFATTGVEDRAFEDALRDAGGSTYLAVFSQYARANGGADGDIAYNLPYIPFRNESWPVAVNVPSDPDGLVRRYFVDQLINDEVLPTAASLMANVFGTSGDMFAVNFALQADSIPTYSVIDLLNGAVDNNAFAGRSVVIGAHALELRDNFAVPAQGILPGSAIHALAAETLIMGRVPQNFGRMPVLTWLIVALVLLQIRSRKTRPWAMIGLTIGIAAMTEVFGLWAFRYFDMQLPSAIIHPVLLAFLAWRLATSLDLSQWKLKDVTARAGNSQRLLEQVFRDSNDIICVLDEDGAVVEASHSASNLFGSKNGELVLPQEIGRAAQEAVEAHRAGRPQNNALRELSVGGHSLQYTVTLSSYETVGHGLSFTSRNRLIATVAARDVTLIRQQRAKLEYLSTHDERTGALERSEFLRQLAAKMADEGDVAVFALKLRRLKTINGTFGREVGDQVLKNIVETIRTKSDTFPKITRLNGNSFAVFTSHSPGPGVNRDTAEALRDLLSGPQKFAGVNVQTWVSVGFSESIVDEGASPEELLDRAEAALAEVGEIAGQESLAYDFALGHQTERSRRIETKLWNALEKNEFSLRYQPQVEIVTGNLVGVEALVRWANSDMGDVGPDEFIEVAESNGFIHDLGSWVLRRACEDAQKMPDYVNVAVNVSGLQLLHGDVARDVDDALARTGLPANRLCLELTETAFVSSISALRSKMDELAELGLSWALDDFGAGYSSFGYLSTLPIQKLKLDKQFIQAPDSDRGAAAIVASASRLAQGLGIEFLCEGVETQQQLMCLRKVGCQLAQGYLFGRPESLETLVTNLWRDSALDQAACGRP